MTTKQAAKARAKKAQRRKQAVAARRVAAQHMARPVITLDVDLDDYEITDDDYLPSGQVKASAALLWCARPAIEVSGQRSGDGFRSVMLLAQIGWNVEVLGDVDASRDLLERARAAFDASDDPEAREMFDELLVLVRAAKRARFADDTRLFLGVNVEDRPEGPHVTVKSAEMPP